MSFSDEYIRINKQEEFARISISKSWITGKLQFCRLVKTFLGFSLSSFLVFLMILTACKTDEQPGVILMESSFYGLRKLIFLVAVKKKRGNALSCNSSSDNKLPVKYRRLDDCSTTVDQYIISENYVYLSKQKPVRRE